MNTSPAAVRAVALFEAGKGLLALLGASGLLLLMHHDLHALLLRLLAHTHLNPASHYPHLLVDAVDRLQELRLWTLVAGAATYASLRFAEAYGLWYRRAWAEVLAALSGAVYVPLEVLALWREPGWLSAGTLALNLAVVALMLHVLWRRRAGADAARP